MKRETVHHIYISEPETIDTAKVRDTLSEHATHITDGTATFKDSDPYPYDTLLIRTKTSVTNSIKKSFPNLKHIIRVGTGLDNVDLDYCKHEGIKVYNAPGANADAVSEYVITVALYALRKLHLLNESDAMEWNRFKFRGHSMSEQVVGIVGFGNIGKLVYEKVRAFGPQKILAYDPYVTQEMVKDYDVTMTSLEEVLSTSTLLTLHLPLLPQTKHMINDASLQTVPRGCIIINASRGGIVDEKSVLERAAEYNITYIADTVENEPDVNPELIKNPNVIITPHIASLTQSSEDAMLEHALNNYVTGRNVA